MNLDTNKKTPNGSNYLGLSFQMGILIFLCAFGGIKLDKIIGSKFIFTVLLSLLAVSFSLYYIVHKEIHKKKKDE